MEERKLNFLEEIIEKDLAEGKMDSIMTRFPPEPNGYLHLGHAKSICLNFGLAQKYGGKTNLRYDDTNPTKEDVEYVDSIKEDIQWLGFQWDKELYASDYFDQLYEWAEELIQRGLAYVDDQTQEEIRLNRGTVDRPGTPSPWRDRTPEENLRLFREMKAGKYAEGDENKMQLLWHATRTKATVLSSMGAALKMDPTRIKVAEFWKVAGCPLARALRDKFKKKKMALKKKVLCVYSDELLKNRGKNSSCGTDACMCPKVRHERSEAELQNANLVDHEWCSSKAQINGTMAHSTAIFGFMIAGLVMQDIYKKALASAE